MLEKKFYLLNSDIINYWMQVSGEQGSLYQKGVLDTKLDELMEKLRRQHNHLKANLLQERDDGIKLVLHIRLSS